MTVQPELRILFQTTRTHLRLLVKSWGARLVDLFMPAAVAFVPILLAGAVAGDEAGFNFARYTGTANFAGFLLIGGGAFMLVTRALWGFGVWIRQEMQSGTLESLYLTPAPMPLILAGAALAFIIYSALIFVGAMGVGALLFQVIFQSSQLLPALAFLAIGLPAVYSLALLYGALVLRLKETDAFIQLAQWLVTLLMGVYFPITIFPTALKFISLLFPPTWLTQGLRSALLDIPYFSGHWLTDMTILVFFSFSGPVLAYAIFARVENSLRKSSGLGNF
jgi:ABC-2 type transport system permease protein